MAYDPNKTIIPINPKTACQNKWAWSSLYLNTGTTASCHRCKHYHFDENTIMNFHNLPEKLEDRGKMLQGEWPGNGCEYCRDVEAVGGISDRYLFNEGRDDYILPEELKQDATSTAVTPTIVEVYFSNLCNQSCVYCRPRFSSQIEYEVKKYGPSKFNDDLLLHHDSKTNYPIYLAKFFEWMTLNGNKLKMLKMLGGEPMYQEEFDMLLDFFDKNPCPNLKWDIFTNLNHDPKKFKEKIEKVQALIENNKLKSMEFICSIDCWGPDVEYVRYGFNIEQAEKNINMILDTPGITIQIHATITALSLPSMYLLADKVNEWEKKKKMLFHWNTVTAPKCFDIYNFGDHLLKDIDFFIERLKSYHPIEANQNSIYGIRTRIMHSTVNVEQVKNLYGYLEELDVRRNDNWKARLPYIAGVMEKIINP